MRPHASAAAALAVLLFAGTAAAKTVESFQLATGNETQAQGHDLQYYENTVWVQKSWTSFERSVHSIYFGSELLLEPVTEFDGGRSRWGRDLQTLFLGYKLKTYEPDWYSFNFRLRVPIDLPGDPFGRSYCSASQEEPAEGEPPLPCAPHRSFMDRVQLRADPLLVQKTWNLFTLYDRNRVTVVSDSIEYGNKVKFIDTIPDLDFPIATYLGDDLRLRKSFGEGGRVRNDFLVGIASNFFDWGHVGVEMKYRLDTTPEQNGAFIAELYVELAWDIYFDNTFGASEKPVRNVATEARD